MGVTVSVLWKKGVDSQAKQDYNKSNGGGVGVTVSALWKKGVDSQVKQDKCTGVGGGGVTVQQEQDCK